MDCFHVLVFVLYIGYAPNFRWSKPMNTQRLTVEQLLKDKRYTLKEYNLPGFPKERFFYRNVKDASIPFLVQASDVIINFEKYCVEDDGNYVLYAYNADGQLMHLSESKGGIMIKIGLQDSLGNWAWYPCGGNLNVG